MTRRPSPACARTGRAHRLNSPRLIPPRPAGAEGTGRKTGRPGPHPPSETRRALPARSAAAAPAEGPRRVRAGGVGAGEVAGGLGIGLAPVNGSIDKHGGRIEARGEGPGKGSEFVVRPASADGGGAAAAPEEAAAAEGGGRGPKRRLLVVDDNVDAAESPAMMLEILGNEVRTAHDGEAGVAAGAAYRPDVVPMDIGMPEMNGFEACRRLRGEPWGRKAVVVAVTGWGGDGDRRKTREAGFDHHPVKPANPDALLDLLTTLPPP